MNSTIFAVIETGGKQYIVEEGKALSIEKLPQKTGESVTFDKVLLVVENGKVTIGTPFIEGAHVVAEITLQKRSQKIRMLRYHSKTRTRRRKGHRQAITQVEIKKTTTKKSR